MNHTNTTGYGTLLLRVVLGAAFMPHALGKLLVFTPAGTAAFFEKIGVPGALAWPIILLELIGGIALILGIGTRWFALLLAADLAGAILTVHVHNGYMANNAGGGGVEYVGMWALALVALALQGDGALALGHLIPGRRHTAPRAA